MGRSHELGTRGEELAASHLKARGWQIVERNWRFHHREIDLVARREDVVAFVEVKTRGGRPLGHPLHTITAAKRRDLGIAARGWIAARGRPGDSYRFDAVAVLRHPSGIEVEHVEDAWRIRP